MDVIPGRVEAANPESPDCRAKPAPVEISGLVLRIIPE
jgi:hypothetical protein